MISTRTLAHTNECETLEPSTCHCHTTSTRTTKSESKTMPLTPYPHTNTARNQLRKRSSPCPRDLLLPLFPSPRTSRAALLPTRGSLREVPERLNSPPLLPLLLFLLPRQTLLEEVAEGGAVNCLTAIAIETMTLQQRNRGTHVTDHACSSLRLRLRQDAGPRTSGSGSLLCPWAVMLASLHLLATVVEVFCQSHRDGHPLMFGP